VTIKESIRETCVISVSSAVILVYQLSQALYEPPEDVYAEIVRLIQEDVAIDWSKTEWGDFIATLSKEEITSTAWKSTSWEKTVRRSPAKAQKKSIFKILEHIGVSEWFDHEVARVASSTGVCRKNAATIVLNSFIGATNSTATEVQQYHRKHLTNMAARGRTARRLTCQLGLGILFSPMIW
jgi:hypothetical protein